jgi:methionine sulfoxide reductase heme-binding subunit
MTQASGTRAWQIWRDRRGRVAPLRVIALSLLLVPAALMIQAYASNGVPGRLWNDLVHRTGYWALIFVLVSLAITPIRRSGRFSGLLEVRRLTGVGAFVYATLHIALYITDEKFDLVKVALEIVKRLYLTIGFIAWLGLLALAITSNDTMVKRLGATRWRRLHQITYVVAFLSLIHFFQQTKADFTLPATITGLFGWLMVYRLVAWRVREPSTLVLFVMTLLVSIATFLGEAFGIALWYKVSPMTVLSTIFDFSLAVRPGWYVLGAGLAVCLLDLVRSRVQRAPSPKPAVQAGGVSLVPRQRA